MKKAFFLFMICLTGLCSFKPAEKTTEPLIGIWINPNNDVKIKIEDVKDQTRATIYWSIRQDVKEHIGRVVIKEIQPAGNHFKAQVIAPERRKFVNAIIEFKSSDTVIITGFDQGKSVSKIYRKVKS